MYFERSWSFGKGYFIIQGHKQPQGEESMTTKIIGALLNPREKTGPEYIPKGQILIDEEGKILAYGKQDTDLGIPWDSTLDYSDFLIAPCFVDCR